VSLVLAAAALARGADPARRWATPDEIHSGKAMGNGFVRTSRNGGWTLYTGTRGLVLVDWKTGGERDAGVRWNMQAPLSPKDGSTLASWIWEEDRDMLCVGTPGAGCAKVLPLPRRLRRSEPVWSPDGKTLYFCAYLDLPWAKSDPRDDHPPTRNNNVSIDATVPPYAYQKVGRRVLDREYPGAYGEDNRTLLLAVDVAGGQARVIARGNDASAPYLSPDGKWVALVQRKRDGGPDGVRSDIYLLPVPPFSELAPIDLENYEERKVGWFDAANRRLAPAFADVGTAIEGLVWSPDSSRFAYASIGRHSTGDVYVCDVATGGTTNLTSAFALPPWSKDLGYGENYTSNGGSPKFGGRVLPLWLPDGSGLVALGHGDAWRVSLDPGRPLLRLSGDVPQETVRILPGFDRNAAGTDRSGRLILVAKDRASRRDSVYSVDPSSGAASCVCSTGMWLDLESAFVCAGGAPLVFSGHTGRMDTNLFRLGLDKGAALHQATRYRMQLLDRRFPEHRILTWKTASGAMGGGVLLLPPEASPERKVPLVIEVHTPGAPGSQIDAWASEGPKAVGDDVLACMKDGIALLKPDIPMSDEGVYAHPMRQVVEGVLAALDAALATGSLDASRVALVGRDSIGPHQAVFVVESVLTQTRRFAVAVCANLGPVSTNWFGDYGPTRQAYFESGPGRFEVPLWEDPARYMENSPIAHWGGVTTPILYINGDGQTYSGLARLGRTAVNALSRESRQEQDIRIRSWLREHFFGDAPTVQRADIPSFFFGSSEVGGE
jgi:dipeptidyl aminopeptidase/acylaminoacyl peptidase